MTLLLRELKVPRKPTMSLAKALHGDREALLQLLLSLCRKNTFNRVERCPTYPVRTFTPDLEERLQLFYDSIASEPFEIAYVLAILYESATKRDHRKRLGQYFTPLRVAKEAINLLAIEPRETVLDPGCGTGIFALSILGALSEKFENDVPLRYLGIENDPLLALSAAVSLDWIDAPKVWRILYANFLNVNRRDLEEIGFHKIDAVVANPPFVRSSKLGERTKLAGELDLSMQAGLHSHFLARSSRLLKHGRMVFIVPIEMNETHYGSRLLEQLRSKFIFNSKIMYYEKENSTWHVESLQKLTLKKHLKIGKVWTLMLFHPVSILKEEPFSQRLSKGRKARAASLGSFASIHRGISTGANDFFVLTNDIVEKIGVPVDYLKKIIPTKTRKAELPTVFSEENWDYLKEKGKPCWLLSLPKETLISDLPQVIRQYIKKGERQGTHLVPTCRNRKPWYYIRIPRIPDMVFTYISRGYPKFIYNKAEAYNLTNLLAIYLDLPAKLSEKKATVLTKFLNSELKNWIDRESAGRKYAGGLIKFEPGDLKNMPVSKSKLLDGEIRFAALHSYLR